MAATECNSCPKLHSVATIDSETNPLRAAVATLGFDPIIVPDKKEANISMLHPKGKMVNTT